HIRRDRAWSGHANLSLSRVNPSFFSISRKWHELENVWWCILSFDPEILTHEGVVFVTTNNIWTGVRRGKGADALEALFAASIYRYATKPPAVRAPECPANYTTCEEAEVLYPQQV